MNKIVRWLICGGIGGFVGVLLSVVVAIVFGYTPPIIIALPAVIALMMVLVGLAVAVAGSYSHLTIGKRASDKSAL